MKFISSKYFVFSRSKDFSDGNDNGEGHNDHRSSFAICHGFLLSGVLKNLPQSSGDAEFSARWLGRRGFGSYLVLEIFLRLPRSKADLRGLKKYFSRILTEFLVPHGVGTLRCLLLRVYVVG